jgi:hypothetical protein
MDALDRANEIRLARAKTKQQVYSGEVSIGDALALECCQSMTVFDLLKAQYRWERARAVRALSRLQMSEALSVAALTERQRGLLCGRLIINEAIAQIEAEEAS